MDYLKRKRGEEMALSNSVKLMKLMESRKGKYYHLFEGFKFFQCFVSYIVPDMRPDIWIDNYENPQYAILHSPPVYFVLGNPDKMDVSCMLDVLDKDSIIVPSSDKWLTHITDHFDYVPSIKERVIINSASLPVEQVKEFNWTLPKNIRTEVILEKHMKRGPVFQDLDNRYYIKRSFTDNSTGFQLVDGDNLIGYFVI
jgi:hypothetical protein